jgi:uncharacterized protein
MNDPYLLPENAFPVRSEPGDLDAPFWAGTREHEIRIQRCTACRRFQWGPDVICHHCHSFDLEFAAVPPSGVIHSWQRSWHPSHPALVGRLPYVTLVVESTGAPGILLIGNLVGDQRAEVPIGQRVEAVFEDHADYTLVHWKPVAS